MVKIVNLFVQLGKIELCCCITYKISEFLKRDVFDSFPSDRSDGGCPHEQLICQDKLIEKRDVWLDIDISGSRSDCEAPG